MPYGPEHDASMALYAAMQSGDPAASRAWAARILSLPATFGKYYETDGACVRATCTSLASPVQSSCWPWRPSRPGWGMWPCMRAVAAVSHL